jgi:hypothetical protein
LALHVTQTTFDLLVSLAIDAARHFGGFQLDTLFLILRFQAADARAGRQGAAYLINHPKTRFVAAEFERRVQHAQGQQDSHAQKCRATLRRTRYDDQFAE